MTTNASKWTGSGNPRKDNAKERVPGPPRLHPLGASKQYEVRGNVGRNDPCPGGCGAKAKRCVCQPQQAPTAPAVAEPRLEAPAVLAGLRDALHGNGEE